jgi:hypothetical protein
MASRSAHYEEERVTAIPDVSFRGRFQPQVSSAGGSTIRPFEADDILRVLDFELSTEPPTDGPLMFGEDGGASGGIAFPVYHCCLRGGYLFYFFPDDVDYESAGPYAMFHGPPVGAVPLEHVQITFPPGGRRVFREHAHTDARTGYELVVLHVPRDEEELTEPRPPVFLVTQSLGQREKWAQALRERSEVSKPTLLRAGFATTTAVTQSRRAVSSSAPSERKEAYKETTTTRTNKDRTTSNEGAKPMAYAYSSADPSTLRTSSSSTSAAAAASTNKNNAVAAPSVAKSGRSTRKQLLFTGSKQSRTNTAAQAIDVNDDVDVELVNAISEFAASNFNPVEWLDNFLQIHGDFEASNKCKTMENTQAEMKKSLKGAVLEQYEYFVQASGEMTTMGKEVAALKQWIETQVETIKLMKEIDFVGALELIKELDEHVTDQDQENDDPLALSDAKLSSIHQRSNDKETKLADELFDDVFNELERSRTNMALTKTTDDPSTVNESLPIDIPNWLDDVTDDIGALVREARYNDAIEMQIKAKLEVLELIDKHEQPTPYRLTQQQLLDLHRLRRTLDVMARRIGNRLEETLRRKNEALRQASKRERSDPNATITTVSPCALDDDALYLQLLVKVGRNQTAAEQYAARRSLLLLEALNERPISGAGSVDLVIYAAQISQSFFSCLANSVEGFLDLFMDGSSSCNALSRHRRSLSSDNADLNDADSTTDSSLHSQSIKGAPAGAVASVVLWCDSELSKFAAAFGGARILSNLPLSPPPRDGGPKKPRVVGEDDMIGGSKDRKNAVDVAAQCIDKAFLYATQNLDSVGLPLAPRLAEYIRQRLKGCEVEVADLLDDRWHHLTVDWRIPMSDNAAH